MRPIRHLLVAALLLLPAPGLTEEAAEERIPVPGSETTYAPTIAIEFEIEDRTETHLLRLTGVALREKVWVNVYAIASYVIEGAETEMEMETAQALADADILKRLHIIMERDVSGEKMASSFEERLTAHHPDLYAEEKRAFGDYLREHPTRKGDGILLTHLPGLGLACRVGEAEPIRIEGVDFARAIWGIYLGEPCVSEDIRKALIARLLPKEEREP